MKAEYPVYHSLLISAAPTLECPRLRCSAPRSAIFSSLETCTLVACDGDEHSLTAPDRLSFPPRSLPSHSGNQYMIDDLSAETTISYAVAHLGVQHVIVMGHYGCGSVQASIASESAEASTDIGEARIDVSLNLSAATLLR